jgi:hypothetical protein
VFVNRNGRPFSANKLREKQLHPLLGNLGIRVAAFIPCVTGRPVVQFRLSCRSN